MSAKVERFMLSSMFGGVPRQREQGMRELRRRLRQDSAVPGLKTDQWYAVVWSGRGVFSIIPAEDAAAESCVQPNADVVDKLLDGEKPASFRLTGDHRLRDGTSGRPIPTEDKLLQPAG